MFELSKLVSNPKIFIAGLLMASLFHFIRRLLPRDIAFLQKNRELCFLLVTTMLLVPVYIQNSSFFTISPDSQGLLRSPAGNTTYRPPLLWWVYRMFANQMDIDQFFRSQPKSGAKLNSSEILQGSNFIMLSYLLSLLFLLWVFFKFLKLDARLLVMVVLVQTSGPCYFLSDYFLIPTSLVPVYKFLFYFILSRFIIIELSKMLPQIAKRDLKTLNSFLVLIFGSVLLLISSRSSLMVDEINQVMTETLTITLINLTLALCLILFLSSSKKLARITSGVLGFLAGLLMIVKLSTLFIPFAILIFIFLLKRSTKEKVILSVVFLLLALIPSLASTVSGANSETSQTWYGLVAYAIEFQSEDPLVLEISQDSQMLLDKALIKRATTMEKYSEIVRDFDFTYQKTSISLYYAALPAAQELGFNNVSKSYTSDLFKEISISSIFAHKRLAISALAENLSVPIGLFKLDGHYMSMSKIFKNPYVYLMFFYIFTVFLSRRGLSEYLFVLLLFSFVIINYLVVSVFNGPVPRYFYLYDPLMLYCLAIIISTCLKDKKEYKT